MIICSMPECQTTAGCKCSEWARRTAASRPARSDKPQIDVRALVASMGYDGFMMAVDNLLNVARAVCSSSDDDLEDALFFLHSAIERMQKEMERTRVLEMVETGPVTVNEYEDHPAPVGTPSVEK